MDNYKELESKMLNDMPFTAHDGDIIQIKINDDKIIIRYALGECDYLWAEDTFKDYWKDQKNVFILDQIFSGVKIIEFEDYGLSFANATCIVNDFDSENRIFELAVNQCSDEGVLAPTLKFSFSNVEYKVLDEISEKKYSKIVKSLDNIDKTKWDKIYTIESD
jgi:hypothetical protein